MPLDKHGVKCILQYLPTLADTSYSAARARTAILGKRRAEAKADKFGLAQQFHETEIRHADDIFSDLDRMHSKGIQIVSKVCFQRWHKKCSLMLKVLCVFAKFCPESHDIGRY